MTEIRSGTWLDARTFPPLHWIVPGIIPEGLTLLVAPPKAGKSWLVYAVALARATGGVVLGQRLSAGPVLYLALEDGWRRLQERGRALLAPGEPLPAGIDYAIRLEPGSAISTVREWLAGHAGANPLVIVDTFGKIKPPKGAGTDAYQHDYAIMGALKSLVDEVPGSAMVLVHHDRKAASDDFLDSVSGTNGIAGAADTTVVIGRARTQGEAVLSVTGREVAEAEYAAVFSAGRWTLAGESLAAAREQVAANRASKNLGDRSAEIVQLIYQNPDGLSPKAIDEALGIGDGIRTYLRRLVEAGRIACPSRGLYTPVTSVTSDTSAPPATTEVTHVADVTPPLETAPCGHPIYRTAKCPLCLADALSTRSSTECRLCGKPALPGTQWCDAHDEDHEHARQLVGDAA